MRTMDTSSPGAVRRTDATGFPSSGLGARPTADRPSAHSQVRHEQSVGGSWPAQVVRLATLASVDLSPSAGDPVWAAFSGLPISWQTVVWHREVEGEDTATVGLLAEVAAHRVDEIRRRAGGVMRDHVMARQGVPVAPACRALQVAWTIREWPAPRREFTLLAAHCESCDPCMSWATTLMTLHFGLRQALAQRVLGSTRAAVHLLDAPVVAPVSALGGASRQRTGRGHRARWLAPALAGAAVAAFVGVGGPAPGPMPSGQADEAAAIAAVRAGDVLWPEEAETPSVKVGSREIGRQDALAGATTTGPAASPSDALPGIDATDGDDSGQEQVPVGVDPPVGPGVPDDAPPVMAVRGSTGLVAVEVVAKDGAGEVTIDPVGPASVSVEVPVPVESPPLGTTRAVRAKDTGIRWQR